MAGDAKSIPSSFPEGVPRPAGLPKPGQPENVSRLMLLHQRLQGKWYYRVPPNHSKPIYQFLGIGLGASMWFWVRCSFRFVFVLSTYIPTVRNPALSRNKL